MAVSRFWDIADVYTKETQRGDCVIVFWQRGEGDRGFINGNEIQIVLTPEIAKRLKGVLPD
ncbi:MAG: hypothetical protein WC359_14205 [Dehalococcoidia bacterium]|jgi:hypothetical protein